MLKVVWVEFPVLDIDRASKFYQTVFGLQPTEIASDGTRRITTLTNPSPENGPGISLTEIKDFKNFEPVNKGAWIYFDTGEDLTPTMNRIESAGGKVLISKTDMGGGFGFYASAEDSEGNLFTLYSSK